MREFSLVHLNRKSTDVTAAASREPVALTHHRTPRYVLMSYEDFQRMNSRVPETRRAYTAENTPEEVAAWLLPALDRFAAGEEAENG